MLKPQLAICIPTYNRADILADRLERMRRMQDHIALEICIADNASTDHTSEVAKRFGGAFAGFRYLRHATPVGPQANFFSALRSATFPYVTQIGDDDAIIEETMREALALLGAESELQAVLGNNIDYDFTDETALQLVEFITTSEKYSQHQAESLFGKYYFLEYHVARRTALEADYYNEGMGYPTGWRLIHAALRHGPIRLEPIPLVRKGVMPGRVGDGNYALELNAIMRADLEWFAASRIPHVSPVARKQLARTALLRSVRYSSDSTITANAQQKYLTALHHAQKAAVYDYDTREYPYVTLDELIYGRLGEWLGQALSATPECTRVVLEDHPACRELAERAKILLPRIQDWRVLPRDALEVSAGFWTVSFTFEPRLANAALDVAGAPYVAVMDLLRGSTVSPWQFERLTGANDGSAVDDDDWSLPTLALLLPEFAPGRDRLALVELAGGTPIASGDGGGSPDRAFDGDSATFWISAERRAAVKGQAWIGYSFAAPHAIRAIRVTQDTNPGYTQDRMRVEKSLDGGESWQPAAPGPFRLSGGRTTIDLPAGEPARLWRLIAAGDNAVEPDHGWTVMGLEFFVPEAIAAAAALVPANPMGGAPIASGDGGGSPDRAFDGDSATFWISAERRAAVKGQAWIGYNFAAPHAIRAIRVTQDTNPGYTQDRMRVEKSQDGGESWQPAAPGPFRLTGGRTTIDLPAGEPARLWRLIAAGDNAVEPDHGWTVMGLEFFVPEAIAASDGPVLAPKTGKRRRQKIREPVKTDRETGAAPPRATKRRPAQIRGEDKKR